MIESDFIAALRRLPLHPGARDLRDDAAVLDIGGETLVLTHDAMAAGVHFLPDADPADVAWKLVATNLSDLAAKGAAPLGVLVGAMLTEGSARFVDGLDQALRAFSVPLLGGDTIAPAGRGGGAVHGLTAIGRATHRPVPSRSGAGAGDGLFVVGTIGAAMLGHALLSTRRPCPDDLAQAYLRPVPLLAEGQALAPRVSAMMDVSDGLLIDAARMAQASGLSVSIDSAAVPFADALRGADPLMQAEALRWGDDYALLFAAAEGAALPPGLHRIGRFAERGSDTVLLDGRAVDGPLGYQHRAD
ncbi:thiamine-phosphate kinase [Sphingomonas sp. CJ99]